MSIPSHNLVDRHLQRHTWQARLDGPDSISLHSQENPGGINLDLNEAEKFGKWLLNIVTSIKNCPCCQSEMSR